MSLSESLLRKILEAALLASGKPLSVGELRQLFDGRESARRIKMILVDLEHEYRDRGINLVRVGSGYRFQTNTETTPWISLLWQERAPRYTRATLETLALIAYRQPITRGEIEQVRGVAVSSQIIRNLLDRGWIRSLGYKDVPGRPALYGTTKTFLDYFGVADIASLPPLEQFTSMADEEDGELSSAEAPVQQQLDLQPADTSELTEPVDEAGEPGVGGDYPAHWDDNEFTDSGYQPDSFAEPESDEQTEDTGHKQETDENEILK